MITQAKINKYVQEAINIANDNSHGYSNTVGDNYGANGDFDCGGFVSYVLYLAGLLSYGTMFEPNERYGNSWSYGTVLEPLGFVKMPFDYNSVKKGDILIKDGHHTELAIGNYKQVGAHDNYDGTRGDYGNAGEISVVALSQGYWDYMYRPKVANEKYSSTTEVVSNYIKGMSNSQVSTAFKPVFNSKYYAKKYPAVAKEVGTTKHALLQHFLNDGMAGNMQGSSTFDCTYYEQHNEDLVKKYGTNYPSYYIHYLKNKKGKTYLYKDIPADYKYYDYAEYITKKKIMNGNVKGYFKKDKEITRVVLVYYLWKVAGQPNEDAILPYTDCDDLSSTMKKALKWAYNHKILRGYKDKTFRPNNKAKKKTTAVCLYRFAGSPEITGSLSQFTDIKSKENTERYKAILWCLKKGIINGNTKNKVWRPDKIITKIDLAIYLTKYMKKIK